MANINDGVQHEQAFEVGGDESWKARIARTYDYNENLVQSVFTQHQQALAAMQTTVQQSANNLVENANLAAKKMLELASTSSVDSQTTKYLATMGVLKNTNLDNLQASTHRDIAFDRQWNIDEQGQLVKQVLDNDDFISELKTIVTNAVASYVGKKA